MNTRNTYSRLGEHDLRLEVLNGGDYDTKSDIYGLGKVMQKLLSIEENKY